MFKLCWINTIVVKYYCRVGSQSLFFHSSWKLVWILDETTKRFWLMCELVFCKCECQLLSKETLIVQIDQHYSKTQNFHFLSAFLDMQLVTGCGSNRIVCVCICVYV